MPDNDLDIEMRERERECVCVCVCVCVPTPTEQIGTNLYLTTENTLLQHKVYITKGAVICEMELSQQQKLVVYIGIFDHFEINVLCLRYEWLLNLKGKVRVTY